MCLPWCQRLQVRICNIRPSPIHEKGILIYTSKKPIVTKNLLYFRIDSKEKRQLLEDYMSGDEDKRAELEKRYGKRKLQNLVSILMDDQYMKSNTKKCPSCNACIQKSEGCNKMTCLK